MIQRVTRANVSVDGVITGEIGAGLLVFLGVRKGDGPSAADYLADKIAGLRIFRDKAGKMNLPVTSAGGSLLVVSQFTLYASTTRGRRPSFDEAAPPELARELYEYFLKQLSQRGLSIATGIFQAHMEVSLVNDGPVTLVIDSPQG